MMGALKSLLLHAAGQCQTDGLVVLTEAAAQKIRWEQEASRFLQPGRLERNAAIRRHTQQCWARGVYRVSIWGIVIRAGINNCFGNRLITD